ncbi:MAG: phosphatase PAP2 family protein [Lautropia sp.]|nr:phosphatase PAP2 family protein [Lautropia sp.]
MPVSLALLLSNLLMVQGMDQWLADQLYAWQGQQWQWRDAWLTSTVLHRGGRLLSVLLCVATLVACIWCWCRPAHQTHTAQWRWPLLYLVLAGVLSTSLVSLLKATSQMDCPWHLTRYGGSLPLVGLFESRPAGMPRAACFPAGHASAGYAWVCLYFVARMREKGWHWIGLSIGLLAGLVFGFTQQLRGAHFLSHDLWSLVICWLVSLGLYVLMRKKAGVPHPVQDGVLA